MIVIDCYTGASGDMLVGALLDTEKNPENLIFKLRQAGLKNVTADIKNISKNSITGTRLSFLGPDKRLDTREKIKDYAGKLKISSKIRKKLIAVYTRIFNAESSVHGSSVDEIHLHEIGGPDTFLEILSFLLLTKDEKIYCRTLTVGRGTAKTAHGEIPVPSPATGELIKNMPVKMSDKDEELLTPTAAAILGETADFSVPDIVVEKTGYGMGKRSSLRIFQGSRSGKNTLKKVEFNVDDMTGEDVGYFKEKASSSAVDIWVVPVFMKKGRPGYKIELLCKEKDFNRVKGLIFKETSTAGFRVSEVNRLVTKRDIEYLNSSYGKCGIKKYRTPSGNKYKPEYGDLKRLAEENDQNITILRQNIMEEFKNE